MTEEAKELARVTTVVQPQKAEPMPKWTNPVPEGMSERAWAIKRMALWLEDAGVDLDKVDLVPTADKQSLALVTATDVPAGATLFEIPDELLFTNTTYSDPDVGRDLRAMASKRQPGRDDDDGFDTFAIGAALAVERVQRGAVRGRLRRQDGGMQVGMINFATDGSAGNSSRSGVSKRRRRCRATASSARSSLRWIGPTSTSVSWRWSAPRPWSGVPRSSVDQLSRSTPGVDEEYPKRGCHRPGDLRRGCQLPRA